MADRSAAPVVFVDACVLYPPLVRAVVLGAAEAGLFSPRWSQRIIDEWRIAAARNGGIPAEGRAETGAEVMAERFPAGCVMPAPGVEMAIDLPDPADAHVLAGAVAAGAEVLLTFNLRDFPTRSLAAYGVTARHPDGFLWELLSGAPEAMDRVIRDAAAAAGVTAPAEVRRALKKARLPRLGKAWEAMAGRA